MEDCFSTTQEIQQIHQDVFGKVKKIAIVMVGGPASGKTSIRDLYMKSINRTVNEFAVIDPDMVLESLGEYKLKREKNATSAAKKCYSVASQINDNNFLFALDNNYNIIFDGTGKDYEWTYNTLIRSLMNKNYNVYICIVTLAVSVAIDRALARALITGRTVPEKTIKQIHIQVNEATQKYKMLNDMYTIVQYDNTSSVPTLVFKKEMSDVQFDRNATANASVPFEGGIKFSTKDIKSYAARSLKELQAISKSRGVPYSGLKKKNSLIS